ncbi:hypothetical protein SAMN04488571_1119 [Methanoculleus thermophilus]|jgi:uncharacterized protein with HEPN domain|uniref:Uncharacterized protein n=1 Tax=Methanoculleus thermophilus TaxID=2200 RepID=A0A1G9BUL5_9EURY|nr:hypothetical protein SAMN04488571_1119 [Methanoculleus thermophilus]
MSRDYNLYLRDILEAIERIERYTREWTTKIFWQTTWCRTE